MPEQPFDVRKAIEQSSSRSTLQELAKKGIHRVKVLDEQMINKLINEAVERIISTKTNLLSTDDRAKLIEASRKELDRLMSEQREYKDKAELAERDKASIIAEVENLQQQLHQQRKYADDMARQRYEDGKNVMRSEVEDMKKKMSSVETQVRKELELEFRAKSAEQLTSVETMKVEVAQKQATMVEEMRKSDEELFKKMSELFTKSIEGVTKKLNDLKLRGVAGVGAGGGGFATDVEFRPSQAVLEGMLAGELDSNLKSMQVEGKSGGKLGNALDRLKAMRGGQGGNQAKPEDKKP